MKDLNYELDTVLSVRRVSFGVEILLAVKSPQGKQRVNLWMTSDEARQFGNAVANEGRA
jgi:hypothetical protein